MDSSTVTVTAYIGLGSNLGDRVRTLESAVEAIGQIAETSVTARSSWYENPAIGIEGGNDFLNGVVEVVTRLSPHDLLRSLQSIEESHGRERTQGLPPGVHESRTLDLDLLLYGNETIEQRDLSVPHPRMRERDFVLIPLRELGVTIPPRG
jgi:2-amino-4-hydroxy-6-hydroxymethyldihydropteridine diphosphokinase